MFNQLTLDQIANMWPVLKGFALESVGTGIRQKDERRMNALLEALLCEEMQCWVSYVVDDEEKTITPLMVIFTLIQKSQIGQERMLVIYGASGLKEGIVTSGDLAEYRIQGWESLLAFAKGMKCSKVVAYTSNPVFLRFLKKKGADVETRYVTLEV